LWQKAGIVLDPERLSEAIRWDVMGRRTFKVVVIEEVVGRGVPLA